jgi:putative SOS response-associated peptidase YedK
MCGRYASSAHPEDLVEEFEVDEDLSKLSMRSILAAPQTPPAGEPDCNMAPTKAGRVVLARAPRRVDRDSHVNGNDVPDTEHAAGEGRDGGSEATRQLRLLTWGLVPSWSKDVKVGLRMINARAESLLGKPSFARAAAFRRCLVPADGWYEWQTSPTALDAKGKPRKQPFFVRRSDGASMAMAGLYEFWRDGALADDDPDAWLTTYAVITTAAEPGLDRLHDRQPLVLERADWKQWLDPACSDLAEVQTLLSFSAPGRFDAYPVSTAVNATRNNGVHLMAPLPRSELRGAVDPTTGEVIGQ